MMNSSYNIQHSGKGIKLKTMHNDKTKNKTAGRIIFFALIIGAGALALMASSNNPPATTPVVITIEHEALQ
jgi:hypothetical protein